MTDKSLSLNDNRHITERFELSHRSQGLEDGVTVVADVFGVTGRQQGS